MTNLASRLADEAAAGQVLIEQRLYAEVEADIEAEPVGELTLKGFLRPITAFNVLAVRESAAQVSSVRAPEQVDPSRSVRLRRGRRRATIAGWIAWLGPRRGT